MKISRCLFTFKYPFDLGIATLPVLKSAEAIITMGFNKVKRQHASEALPEPRKTSTAGLVLIEFYMESGALSDLNFDLMREVKAYTIKHRLPSIDGNKLDLLKKVGVEWKFDELEEWKPEAVKSVCDNESSKP